MAFETGRVPQSQLFGAARNNIDVDAHVGSAGVKFRDRKPARLKGIVAGLGQAANPLAPDCDQDEVPLQALITCALEDVEGRDDVPCSGGDGGFFEKFAQGSVGNGLAVDDLAAWKAPQARIRRIRAPHEKCLAFVHHHGDNGGDGGGR
jgi:hypothetical protein